MNSLLLTSFIEVMQKIGYVALALLLLMLMITVHEFGHYIAGKIFGFQIKEFAIGFGPKLFKFTKKNDEIFSIRLIPVGGYCAFLGEEEDDANPKAFYNKPPWQRIIVLISGAFMNYLLAVFFIILMFSCYGQTSLKMSVDAYQFSDPVIEKEYEGKRLLKDDIILKIDGKTIYTLSTDIIGSLDGKKKGEVLDFLVIRDGKEVHQPVKLYYDGNFQNMQDTEWALKMIGSMQDVEGETSPTVVSFYGVNIKNGFWTTIGHSFEYSIRIAGSIFICFGQLFTGKLGISSLGGTITTISVTSKAIAQGGFYFLNMSSFLGVNLAVFNLLPIPALDGAHVVFTIIEWIRRKPINRKVENTINTIGLLLLLGFAIFVDISKLFIK